MTSSWEEALWQELDASPPAKQYRLISDYIYTMSQMVLPRLGSRRRQVIMEALQQDPGLDAVRFAEDAGASANTIKRLLGDARAMARRRQ